MRPLDAVQRLVLTGLITYLREDACVRGLRLDRCRVRKARCESAVRDHQPAARVQSRYKRQREKADKLLERATVVNA